MGGFSSSLSEVGPFALAAGKAMGGLSAKSSAFDQAKLLKRRAAQTRAASQRAAGDERKAARLLMSTLRARAAAGGGSASDEGVVNVLAEIDAQGEMNALTRLHDGDIEAGSDEYAAQLARNEGRAAMTSAMLATVGTAAEASFAEKYGPGPSARQLAAPLTEAQILQRVAAIKGMWYRDRTPVNKQPGGFDPLDYYG